MYAFHFISCIDKYSENYQREIMSKKREREKSEPQTAKGKQEKNMSNYEEAKMPMFDG